MKYPEDEFFRGPDMRRCWERYCGFLDLSLDAYMDVQRRLLAEQVKAVVMTALGSALLGERFPPSLEGFLEGAPVTDHRDYETFLANGREDALAEKPWAWCLAFDSAGQAGWVPYTRYAVEVVCRYFLAAVVLACAHERGQVNCHPGDRLLYAAGPQPCFLNNVLQWANDRVSFRTLLPPGESGGTSLAGGTQWSFYGGPNSGVDVVFSTGRTLERLGDRTAELARSWRLRPLHPRALWAFARGMVRSRLAGRALLPRDLWSPRAIITVGADTGPHSDGIAHYWGQDPFQVHASTEAGLMALQSWTRKGLTFLPEAAFWEFIPQEGANGAATDPRHPNLLTMDQLEAGKVYEVVFTSFYGMPFLRYRTGDLIKVLSLEDPEAGVRLPQVLFHARTDGWMGRDGGSANRREDSEVNPEGGARPTRIPADPVRT